MKSLIILLLVSFEVFGHGNIKHTDKKTSGDRPLTMKDSFKSVYENINMNYKLQVEIIFKSKCFDCHSAQTKHPWYYQIPGINLLMNSHIKEARSHMDMNEGFPFKGHGTPFEDLKELEKTITENTMPPLYYKVFHSNSSLTQEEKDKIINWINNSKHQLKELK